MVHGSVPHQTPHFSCLLDSASTLCYYQSDSQYQVWLLCYLEVFFTKQCSWPLTIGHDLVIQDTRRTSADSLPGYTVNSSRMTVCFRNLPHVLPAWPSKPCSQHSKGALQLHNLTSFLSQTSPEDLHIHGQVYHSSELTLQLQGFLFLFIIIPPSTSSQTTPISPSNWRPLPTFL